MFEKENGYCEKRNEEARRLYDLHKEKVTGEVSKKCDNLLKESISFIVNGDCEQCHNKCETYIQYRGRELS